ncbi:MAG: hypothetical protein U1E45_21845 [Geminicoccaceae bacterium]
MRSNAYAALAFGSLVLAGCSSVDTNPGIGGNYLTASNQLLQAAMLGPVPLSVDTVPAFGTITTVAAAASSGASWANPRFDPTAPLGGPMTLALRFDQVPSDPVAVCNGTERRGSAPAIVNGELRVHAIACAPNGPVADQIGRLGGTDSAALNRLVSVTVSRLFPSPNGTGQGSVGLPGINIFGGLGTGSGGGWGSGVGVGVGF